MTDFIGIILPLILSFICSILFGIEMHNKKGSDILYNISSYGAAVVLFCVFLDIFFFGFQKALFIFFILLLIWGALTSLVFGIFVMIRKSKLKKSPLFKQAVNICKTDSVKSVYCQESRLIFYNKVFDSDRKSFERKVNKYSPEPLDPEGMVGLLPTGKMDYQTMRFFANCLSKKMGGCKISHHKILCSDYSPATTISVNLSSGKVSSNASVHYYTVYSDYYVYKK